MTRLKYWALAHFMRFAHRHGWHKVKRIELADGDVHNLCEWCGLREVLKHNHLFGMPIVVGPNMPKNSIILTNLKMPEDYHG